MKQLVILTTFLILCGLSTAFAQQVDKNTYPLKALFPDGNNEAGKGPARKANFSTLPEARATSAQAILEMIFKTLPPTTASKPAPVIAPDNAKIPSGTSSVESDKVLKAAAEQLNSKTTMPVMQQSPDARPANVSKPQNQ